MQLLDPLKWTLIKWVALEANVKEEVPQKSSSQGICAFTNWFIYWLISVIVLNVQSQLNYDVSILCYRTTEFELCLVLRAIEQWYFFKLATNAYQDDQQLSLLGERILRCLCGLRLLDSNPWSSAHKVNALTIGPPWITIIIKSKVITECQYCF